jgi:hypothetical protein
MGPRRQSREFSRWSVRSVGMGDRKTLPGLTWCGYRCTFAACTPPPLRSVRRACVRSLAVFGQLVSRCGSVRDRALTGHVSMCQRLRWVSRLRLGCMGMTSLLGSPAPDALVLAFSVAHCGFGGE